MSKAVEVIEREAIVWPFEQREGPYVMVGQGRWGQRRAHLDPFPAYAHDERDVWDALDLVAAAWPLPDEVSLQISILPCEDLARTNGWTQHDWHRDYEDGQPVGEPKFIPTIALSAKRIPPHPAVTRYLVAHEYGHVVAGWLAKLAGYQNSDPRDVEKEYAKIRELGEVPHYGGGSWHIDHGEVMANDFRILICGVETEYWPHPTIDRPDGELEAVLREWWLQRGPIFS